MCFIQSLPSVHLHRSSMSMLVSSTDYQVSSFLPGDLERLSSITEHPKKVHCKIVYTIGSREKKKAKPILDCRCNLKIRMCV